MLTLKHLALTVTALATFGCAATPTEEASSNESNLDALPQVQNVYVGSVDVAGAEYGVEVTVTLGQHVTQTKFCDPGVDDLAPFSSAYLMPDRDEAANTITTTVRAPDGRVVGTRTTYVRNFYANRELSFAEVCSRNAEIVDRSLTTNLELQSLLVWVPGIAVDIPNGQLWVNPSYLGPTDAPVSLEGKVRYAGSSDVTAVRRRPFGSDGQEIDFAKGTATAVTQPTLDLEIGIGPQSMVAADRIEYLTLRRR